MAPSRLLPAAPGERAPASTADDRRGSSRSVDWELVVVGELGQGRFLASHAPTGRSYRLAVVTLAEAEAAVALLNDATLEISA